MTKTNPLSALQIETAREQLTALRETLRAQKTRMAAEPIDEAAERAGMGGADRGDEAAAVVNADMRLASAERTTRKLEAVEEALARIRDGTYGICLDCDQPIAPARLDAEPAAVRCIECQARVEDDRDERDATPSL